MFSDAEAPTHPARQEPDRSAAAAQVWHDLGQRLAVAPLTRRLQVQHLVLSEDDVQAVGLALKQAGLQIGLELVLDARDGDLVLLDRELADQMSPQLIAAFREGRPCLVLGGLRPGEATSRELRRELRRQLLALPMLQPLLMPGGGRTGDGLRPAQDPALDSTYDSIWQLDTPEEAGCGDIGLQLLQQLHRRQGDTTAAPLRASYGPGADLHFDFRQARVQGDMRAMQLLRLQNQLPVLVPDLSTPAHAETVPLRHALWDLGVAAGALPLQAAPADWWHAPLQGQDFAGAGPCTRVPRYLEVMRRLAGGAVTAAELRREGRISVVDLRRVLQACLLLGLARWRSAPFTSTEETSLETAEQQT